MKITHITARLLLGASGLLPLAASATETLFAQVDMSPPVNCGVPPTYQSNTTGATLAISCSDNERVGDAAAVVDHGRVGASTSATDVTQSMVSMATAIWEDDSAIISVPGNPGQRGTVQAALNFVWEGGFGGFGAPSSNTVAVVGVGIAGNAFGAFLQHTDSGDSCQNTAPVDFCSPFDGSVGLRPVLTTPVLTFPVNTPFEVDYLLQLSSEVTGPGASTNGAFLHTLGFVSGGPVLTFSEPGYTFNAGDYIIDNVYVASVDEPAAPGLLALGLAGLASQLRGRRFARRDDA